MSDSHSKEGGNKEGVARKVIASALLFGGYVGAKAFIKWVFPTATHDAIEQVVVGSAAAYKAICEGIVYIGGHIVAHKIEGNLFDHGDHSPSSTGLERGFESALARAAASSICELHSEWLKGNAQLREWDIDAFAEDEAIEVCRIYVESGANDQPPEFLQNWLRSLADEQFIEKPDLDTVGWRHRESTQEPVSSGKFSDLLMLRWGAVFQRNFSDELAKHDIEYRKFSIAIFDRVLANFDDVKGLIVEAHAGGIGHATKEADRVISELGSKFEILTNRIQAAPAIQSAVDEGDPANGAAAKKKLERLRANITEAKAHVKRATEALGRCEQATRDAQSAENDARQALAAAEAAESVVREAAIESIAQPNF